MKEQVPKGATTANRNIRPAEPMVLWLYVTGATSRSARAISNIRRICDTHLGGNVDLRIVDIYIEPQTAVEHQIVASPTLVKISPAPVRRLIGDLSDERRTLAVLGIEPVTAVGL